VATVPSAALILEQSLNGAAHGAEFRGPASAPARAAGRRLAPARSCARPLALTLAAALAATLAGCAGDPLATYDLSAPTSGLSARPLRASVVVSAPEAVAPLDSDRIVVRAGAEGVTLLKGAQWSDRLPTLVQSRLIQTFENGRSIRSVSRPGDRVAADYNLVSEIRRFEIDASTRRAVAEISVRLVRDRSGAVVAGRVFEASAPVETIEGAGAVAALDEAMGRALRDIAAWAAAPR